MSPGKVPRDVSGREFRKAVQHVGFEFKRQRGSHMVLFRANPPTAIVVPDHQTLRVGLLRKLIDQAGLTMEEFSQLLR